LLVYDTGHRNTKEQRDEVNDWLAEELTGRGRQWLVPRWKTCASVHVNPADAALKEATSAEDIDR
jgi:hypothetical protein